MNSVNNASSPGSASSPLKPAAIHPKLLQTIIDLYQLRVKQIKPAQTGYRNTNIPLVLESNLQIRGPKNYPVKTTKTVNLVLFKNEPRILKRQKNANQTAGFLANQGFPLRLMLAPKKTKDSNYIEPAAKILKISRNNHSEKYAGLFTYLPGKTISWEAYTQKHLKLAGQVMSSLHASLSQLPSSLKTKLPNQVDELEILQQKMRQYLLQTAVESALGKKLSLEMADQKLLQTSQLFSALRELESSQPLHMDFVRSNILFSEKSKQELVDEGLEKFSFNSFQKAVSSQKFLTISGILDFEKVSMGPKVIDIARTLAFLLVDCKYKTPDKVRKYFLQSGYHKRGLSRLKDLQFLQPLVVFFWLHDFYKFLKHNPYQALSENEHFVRTQKFLLNKNILQKT